MYSIGDRFKIETNVGEFSSDEYLLMQVAVNKVCMMNLETFNRWADPITVKDIYNITESEFSEIASPVFDCKFIVIETSKYSYRGIHHDYI